MGLIEEFIKSSPGDIKSISEKIVKEDISNELESIDEDSFVTFLMVIPEDKFIEIIDKYRDIIAKRISSLSLHAYARLIEELPGSLRKEFNKRFIRAMQLFIKGKTLKDILKLLYLVSPPNRSKLMAPWRQILFSKTFSNEIIEASLEDIEAFLSTVPEDIRKQFLKRHKTTLLSEQFSKKLEEAATEEIVNLLRWFPQDLYREFIDAHKDIFEKRGLKL